MKRFLSVFFSAVLTFALFAPAGFTVAAQTNTPETYTINFKGNSLPANAEEIVKQAGGQVVRKDQDLNFVQAVSSNPDFLTNIRANPAVEDAGRTLKIVQEGAVEKVAFTGEVSATSEHPLYEQYQWDIKQVTGDGKSFQIEKGNKNVVVAVIDTGIDLEHPDLKANIVEAKSFVPEDPSPQDFDGHGSHVAGSIAANGKVLGIGPELGIASLKVFGRDGFATTASIAEALKYAADRDYDVVNMSLGGYYWLQDPAYDTSDIRAEMNLFKKAISYARSKGVVVVGSAGNAGVDIHNPAKLTNYLFGDDANGATHRDPSSNLLIRVSAGNKNKQITFYSNYGVGVIDLMAPGGDLGPNYDPVTKTGRDYTYLCLSTVPILDADGNVTGHGYAWYAGTSMAAPKVAGVAALVIAKHGKNQLNPSQVEAILAQSAEDLYKKGKDEYTGNGLVNAVNALNHK